MDHLDRKLLDAWQYTRQRLIQSEAGRAEARRRFESFARSQLAAPLRSWALVLRASDTRIETVVDEGLSVFHFQHSAFNSPPYNKMTGDLLLTRSVLEQLCRPVWITSPGVRIYEAAKRLGVSRQTIWRWAGKKSGTLKAESGVGLAHFSGLGERQSGKLNSQSGQTENKSGKLKVESGRKIPKTENVKQTRTRGNEDVVDAPFWVGRVRSFAANGLVKDLYPNRADRKRDETLYWTSSPLDPGGLTAMGQWGALRSQLLDKFKVLPTGVMEQDGVAEQDGGDGSDGDEQGGRGVQIVSRAWREQAGRHGRWQWVCEGRGPRRLPRLRDQDTSACLEYCDKLYWPLPVWTIAAMFDQDAAGLCNQPLAGGFVCRNCAGLVYESSEAHWGRGEKASERDAKSEGIAFRRFVQRMSAGMVG